MADDYELALQVAVRAVLAADLPLSGLIAGRIYDEPPDDVEFPYVRFGDFEPQPFDTGDTEGAEIIFGLEIYSRPEAGRVEATQIAGACRRALHRKQDTIAVAGFHLLELLWLTQTVGRKPDGKTYQGTLAFKATLDSL